ncbi:MAG: hypothetical protein AB7C97_09620 [Oscillospiraceae bacterium]
MGSHAGIPAQGPAERRDGGECRRKTQSVTAGGIDFARGSLMKWVPTRVYPHRAPPKGGTAAGAAAKRKALPQGELTSPEEV